MVVSKSSEIPEDAVALDEIQAIEYVWNVVQEWESTSDVWALKYSPIILGGINALAGVIINNYYRRKLNLGSFGYFASVIPMTVMPAILTTLFHRHLISTSLLLMKNEGCPVCYEVRAAAVQIGLGVAYPMVLGPTCAFMLAQRYCTFRVPELSEGPKVMFKFLRKTSRAFSGTLTFLAVGQVLASSILTYYEMKNNFVLRQKISAIEAKLTNNET